MWTVSKVMPLTWMNGWLDGWMDGSSERGLSRSAPENGILTVTAASLIDGLKMKLIERTIEDQPEQWTFPRGPPDKENLLIFNHSTFDYFLTLTNRTGKMVQEVTRAGGNERVQDRGTRTIVRRIFFSMSRPRATWER